MPKVYLRETDKMMNGFKEFILGRCSNKHISQSQVAYQMGISRQSFSNKMKKLTFTVEELIELFDVLGVEEEDIDRFFLKRKKGEKCIN